MFKQSLKGTLRHTTVANQVLINMTLHDPLTKPNKLALIMFGLVPPDEKLTTSLAFEPLLIVLITPPYNEKAATCRAAF